MLDVLWRIGAPYSPSGYGRATREIVPRMMKDGHRVLISCVTYSGPPMSYEGMTIWGTQSPEIVNFIIKTGNNDYIFTAPDYHGEVIYPKWIACAALDFEFVHTNFVNVLKQAKHIFAVSQHNKRELERVGFKVHYAPWGVDTVKFCINNEARKRFRTKLGIDDDVFLIGSVGANLQEDRKNFITLIKAFQILAQNHMDVALYLHTAIYGHKPIIQMIQSSGLTDRIFYVDQRQFYLGCVREDELVEAYNGFDVLCIPSKGESFCLPLLEAQACGTPAIVTNTTALPEHLGGGWLIPVTEDDYELSGFGAWWACVRPSAIADKLDEAYLCRRDKFDDWVGKSLSARNSVLKYDWDLVYDTYWKPFLSYIEENK